MEENPPLYLGVVAIEKGAFGSPSTKVANITFTFVLFAGFLFEFYGISIFEGYLMPNPFLYK